MRIRTRERVMSVLLVCTPEILFNIELLELIGIDEKLLKLIKMNELLQIKSNIE